MKNLFVLCLLSVGYVSFANAIICNPTDTGDGTICLSETPEEAAAMKARAASSLATAAAMESQESHNESN